jgi:hypothetical protein
MKKNSNRRVGGQAQVMQGRVRVENDLLKERENSKRMLVLLREQQADLFDES